MWLRGLAILSAGLLSLSPLIWPEGDARAWVSAVVGIVAMVLVPVSIFERRAGWGLVVAGSVLGLSNFVFLDNALVIAICATAALTFIASGLAVGETAEPIAVTKAAETPAKASSEAKVESIEEAGADETPKKAA